MSDQDGYLDERVQQWIQNEADSYFEGNFGRAAAAILTAAWEAEQEPKDPWAGLDSRIRQRGRQRKQG